MNEDSDQLMLGFCLTAANDVAFINLVSLQDLNIIHHFSLMYDTNFKIFTVWHGTDPLSFIPGILHTLPETLS